jgi:hypothetical protein
MTNISLNNKGSNGKSFCNYCDYGPLGFDTCSPRAHNQEERINNRYCGYANIDGVEITNKDGVIIINNGSHDDIEIPKQDLMRLRTELDNSIKNGQQKYDHPKPSILSRLFEEQEANV